jgi:integrase
MQILLTRNKTKNTKRKITKIIIDITEDSWRIILKYKTNKTDGYVFDTLNESMNSEEKKTKVQNFVRYINQHLKNLCTKNDISEHITSSFSRHSYATTIIRTSGGNKALAQELLGHSSIITTERYFAGFESEDRKNVNENLLNFNDNE